jgi:hypothetical protein
MSELEITNLWLNWWGKMGSTSETRFRNMFSFCWQNRDNSLQVCRFIGQKLFRFLQPLLQQNAKTIVLTPFVDFAQLDYNFVEYFLALTESDISVTLHVASLCFRLHAKSQNYINQCSIYRILATLTLLSYKYLQDVNVWRFNRHVANFLNVSIVKMNAMEIILFKELDFSLGDTIDALMEKLILCK